MKESNILPYLKNVIQNMPADWLNLTTHRLDIYVENLAKTDFLQKFEKLYEANNSETSALSALPTAYDYIRLGHPLSCILEWGISKIQNLNPDNIIVFSSQTTPILAILRTNSLKNISSQILYKDKLPEYFDADIIRKVYGFNFNLKKIESQEDITPFEGSTIFIHQENTVGNYEMNSNIDFLINFLPTLGSILIINGKQNEKYISDIQHFRRRETVAMTPADTLTALKMLTENSNLPTQETNREADKKSVQDILNKITGTTSKALVASSGLSMQYAIMMGAVHDAIANHPGKAIKFIVPPNCYGGTNDQARRVADSLENVEIVDLPVDGDNDMVQSIDRILDKIAQEDAVPYIIAEIPTNPRVEVPNLENLKAVLSKNRKTSNGADAIDSIFILDQTFCPNVHFLGEGEILSTVRSVSYASGSKFPSGGKCTAGYVVGNAKTNDLMDKIELHQK